VFTSNPKIVVKAKVLIAILLLAVLLPLALIFSSFMNSRVSNLGRVETGTRREVETMTTYVETRQTETQATTYTNLVYKATGLPKVKQYELFEIIDIPGQNHSISVVHFEQVPNAEAVLYEYLPNGTVVTHFNVTFTPKLDETLYLATIAYVIRGEPEKRGINIPEGACMRRHDKPVTAANCFILPSWVVSDLLPSVITIGFKTLFGEGRLQMELIDEYGRHYRSVQTVQVDVMNVTTSDGSWRLVYKEYYLRGLGDYDIRQGSYIFILPKDAKPSYLYVYISKTGILNVFDPVDPVALITLR